MAANRVAVTVLVVLVAGVVAAVPLTGSVAFPTSANQQATAATPVGECTTITEPGQYELASDLDGSDGVCLHVQTSDVTLDGNGHTVAGTGTDDSVGLLVYGAARDASVDAEDAVDNVTVRDVTVANWARGVQVGTIRGVGTEAALQDVTARENSNAGAYFGEAENVAVDGLRAADNANGVFLWEVQDSEFARVDAVDNDDRGVALLQDVYDVAFRNLTATGNGNGGYSSGGLYASTDARDNTISGAYLADNEGAGARFSDSGENVLEDAVVQGNTGPGVHGVPAGADRLRNVTVRDNGGPAVDVEEGELSAARVAVGSGASVAFENEGVTLDRAPVSDAPSPPNGSPSVERGLDLGGVETGVDVTFSGVGGPGVELWVFDGTDWQPVDDATVAENGSVSGTVTTDGLVVPVQTADGSDGDGTESDVTATTSAPATTTPSGSPTATTQAPTTGSPTTADPTTADQTAAGDEPASDDASTFRVASTRADHEFGYVFVVDGAVERVDANDGDRVVEHDDGTVTVVGSTGDRTADAYRVTGEVTEFYTPASPDEYELELDGENVTDSVPAPNE